MPANSSNYQYAYSAWAPQFAERMKLSSKESNLIVSSSFLRKELFGLMVDFKGAAGNLGMYASGIPLGLLIDSRGPRIAVLIGAAAIGGGYYPIHIGMVLLYHSESCMLICF